MVSQETASPPSVAAGAPRVFVSYAWEDDEYRVWVKRLATTLRQDGIDARLDAWHCRDRTIPEFMNSEARLAHKVLIVCSPKYREKVHAMEDGERMTGSGWEAMLVGATLFAGRIERAKIVACLARGEWKMAAPDFLVGLPYFDLSAEMHFEAQYLELLRALHGAQEKAPQLGSRPTNLQPAPLAPLRGTSSAPLPPIAPPALAALRDALAVGATTALQLEDKALQEILRHSPSTLDEYRLARIAEWAQPRYALDKRFTRLTLLLDQGPEAQGARWQPHTTTFDDLRDVLDEATEPALVLLGPPGCGKSTLLRRLELDLAIDALRTPGDDVPSSFFLPLNRYRPARPGEALPMPQEWLEREWARHNPHLPPLAELLRGGRLVLLLDAVNEMPHADEADYRSRVELWRESLVELARSAPGARVLFSCRSLDYSASLSTKEHSVPHVRIEQLGDEQVEEFLALYDPEHGPAVWEQLRGTPQLDLFRSPFYLKLLAGPGRRRRTRARGPRGAVHRLRAPGAGARDRGRQSAVSPRGAPRSARLRAHRPARMARPLRPAHSRAAAAGAV